MKNSFTADGFNRWMSSREARKRKALIEAAKLQKPSIGLLGRIWLWLKIELGSSEMTNEKKEKASPKILW